MGSHLDDSIGVKRKLYVSLCYKPDARAPRLGSILGPAGTENGATRASTLSIAENGTQVIQHSILIGYRHSVMTNISSYMVLSLSSLCFKMDDRREIYWLLSSKIDNCKSIL
ncbi:hypothetical protein LOD99_15219 [Oopsacas minuta]|uniref:Uncharacterized protein n=1 Tax=Oopsacas minuta TaxID=111878 RepID=A0AAV7KAB7_9METZ|nr:hypothetical protein LOD99_15219 [Oopsacas minuta]